MVMLNNVYAFNINLKLTVSLEYIYIDSPFLCWKQKKIKRGKEW